MVAALPVLTTAEVRAKWIAREELALLDVREEDPFATGHPLFAANLPISRIELDAPRRLPRSDVTVVVYDDGEGLAERAARRLEQLGYTRVHLLAGGLQGWREASAELFRDVNSPSKAFGELVEAQRHTPSLPADEVKTLLDRHADVVVLDARRYDEYRTMSIPGAISVPGAELVLQAQTLAPNPATQIIVNCAGRTRSLIGAQSLINAGLPNPVAALRNGTIGWTLAGHALEHRQERQPGAVAAGAQEAARAAAQRVAAAAGVRRVAVGDIAALADAGRTVYRLDVRSLAEFEAGHLPGFDSAPGGQLVQETDHVAPARGARLVLASADGVRAEMTASWLAQMGWEVWVVDDITPAHLHETGPGASPALPQVVQVQPHELASWLREGNTVVLDVGPSAAFVRAHVPGAWWALRSQLPQVLLDLPRHRQLVLTCPDGALSSFTAADFPQPVAVLQGGTSAWAASGLALDSGEHRLLSPRIDRYRRPYEGTDNPHQAMQAYLDWEFGLVAQLARDGTHGFEVLSAAALASAQADS